MQQRALKVVIFDFDCTLTVAHVFASFSGAPSTSKPTLEINPPYVRSELGQLLRLADLDNEEGWGPGVFALRIFGGTERLEQLRGFLSELQSEGIVCMVCSRGMQATLRKCLEQVNLLCYFSATKGSRGTALGMSSYDMELLHPGFSVEGNLFLDSTSFQALDDKYVTISKWMQERRLQPEEVLYIDDECEEILRVKHTANTLLVTGSNGMGETEFHKIRTMVKNGMTSRTVDQLPRAVLAANEGDCDLKNHCATNELDCGFKRVHTQDSAEARNGGGDLRGPVGATVLRSYKAHAPGIGSVEAPRSRQSLLRLGKDSPELARPSVKFANGSRAESGPSQNTRTSPSRCPELTRNDKSSLQRFRLDTNGSNEARPASADIRMHRSVRHARGFGDSSIDALGSELRATSSLFCSPHLASGDVLQSRQPMFTNAAFIRQSCEIPSSNGIKGRATSPVVLSRSTGLSSSKLLAMGRTPTC